MRWNRLDRAVLVAAIVSLLVLASVLFRAPRSASLLPTAENGKSTIAIRPQLKLVHRDSPVARDATDDEDTLPVFKVWVDSELTGNQKTLLLHQKMATALTTFAIVPKDRTHFYSAVTNHPEFALSSWGGSILEIKRPVGGYVVNVGVYPIFSNRSTVLGCTYIERFLITDKGTITFLGSDDPNGAAGTLHRVVADL